MIIAVELSQYSIAVLVLVEGAGSSLLFRASAAFAAHPQPRKLTNIYKHGNRALCCLEKGVNKKKTHLFVFVVKHCGSDEDHRNTSCITVESKLN